LKKLKAIELRKQGLSYSEIKNLIPASKLTFSAWLKDIQLSQEQRKRLSRLQAAAYSGAKKIQAESLAHHKRIREKAKAVLGWMIKLMMRWLRQICRVPETKFRIGFFSYSLDVKEDYLSLWSRIT
jgi:hypothetical protein